MNCTHIAFPASSLFPRVLYIGLSLTHSHSHSYTNECLLTYHPLEVIGVHFHVKDTSACGQLEPGFEPPTLRLSVLQPALPILQGEGSQLGKRIEKRFEGLHETYSVAALRHALVLEDAHTGLPESIWWLDGAVWS